MCVIAIFVDIEEGHVLPTFWLSRYLESRGHKVCYLGHQNLAQLVKNNGFTFITVMEGGSSSHSSHEEHGRLNLVFGPLVRGELLEGVLADLHPDVALVHSEYYLEGLGFRDHSACAERVAYHGLGVQNDDPQISSTELIRLIEQVINDPSFNQRVGQIREKFKQQARLDIAADVIEKAVNDHGSGLARMIEPDRRVHLGVSR